MPEEKICTKQREKQSLDKGKSNFDAYLFRCMRNKTPTIFFIIYDYCEKGN